MEQELYYLIAKFLSTGPCKDAARVLENELKQNRELLPHTITYEGDKVPMTMDRLSSEYPNVNNTYLLELLSKFLDHIKEAGDPKIPRISALRHGDKSLLTMLSAVVPDKQIQKCNYLTMTQEQLDKLSIHRMLIAREMGARTLKSQMPTALSTFYRESVDISGHRNGVYNIMFDKTNRRLFTGSDDGLVKVWCVRTGYLIHTIRGHANPISDMTINEENTLLVTCSSDGTVRVWTMDEYKPIMCLRPNTAQIKPFTTVKFSPSPKPDTRYLLATNEDGLVRLWRWNRDTLQFYDIDTPITFSCKFKGKDRLRCSSFNYTGTKFAVAGDDGFVYVFSTVPVKTGHEGIISHSGDQSSQQDRPGKRRKRVASALFPDKNGYGQDQPVTPIGVLEGHMGSVTDLAYSHDGRRILSGCSDGTARVWAFDKTNKTWSSIVLDIKEPMPDAPIVSSKTPTSSARESKQSSNDVEMEQDEEEFGTLLPFIDESAPEDINMEIDPHSPQHTAEAAAPNVLHEPLKVSMIVWSADDKWCLVASNYGEIRVYNSVSGKIACILHGHQGEVYTLDSHPFDPSTILSAGYDGNVILWDIVRQNITHQTHHAGSTFTDCKFSKDAMKYAIADEGGHCTLYSIGGFDKDYEQVREWNEGQRFYTDYMDLRHNLDGTFFDFNTGQEPYALPPTLILNHQGNAYPKQKKLGYGRNIPTNPETFELEDIKRSACYDMEEEELRLYKIIVLPTFDRASLTKRRREFVFEEDDDAENNGIPNYFQPPLAPILIPDDPEDEDYHEDNNDAGNADYQSSSGSSDEEVGSDDFVARDGEGEFVADEPTVVEDGPRTRSRGGVMQEAHHHPTSEPVSYRRSTSGRGRGRRRGRGRGGASGNPRKRSRENRETSDDDQPVRARRRFAKVEYKEQSESELEPSSSEEEEINVDNEESDEYHSDYAEAGPSKSNVKHVERNRSASNHNRGSPSVSTRRANATLQQHDEPEDRKGKRKLRSAATHSDPDFASSSSSLYHNNGSAGPSSSSSARQQHALAAVPSSSAGRTTRNRSDTEIHIPLNNIPASPSTPPHNNKHNSNSKVAPTNRRVLKTRDEPRELTEKEIKEHEPIPWITSTERSLIKYLPQLQDRIVIMNEGHKQYLKSSDMKEFFDGRHGVIDKHEPVLFAQILKIDWQVGPPAYCKLKLAMYDIANLSQVVATGAAPIWIDLDQQEVIEYSDEDGSPEFIVIWERFYASLDIFKGLRTRAKVDALYDEGTYTGEVLSLNQKGLPWKKVNMPSPWAYYHVKWEDQNSSSEDLCPWELVPSGQDFRQKYSVEPSLSAAQIRRAQAVVDWLSSAEDFDLYVHQVDYYQYPAYLSLIAYPICLDIIAERLANNFYRSEAGLIDDCDLIKKNAMKYNDDTSPAHKNAVRMFNFFKTRIEKPGMALTFNAKGNKGKAKVVKDESDDEYDNNRYESEEEIVEKAPSRDKHYSSDEEDNFIASDNDEEDYYE